MENSTIEETENPFTIRGLLLAIINDLNDLHQKVEILKRQISENTDNSIFKEVNSKND